MTLTFTPSPSCPTPHRCGRCGEEYACTVPDWVCPTLNGDENGNLCDACEDALAEEMQAAHEAEEEA